VSAFLATNANIDWGSWHRQIYLISGCQKTVAVVLGDHETADKTDSFHLRKMKVLLGVCHDNTSIVRLEMTAHLRVFTHFSRKKNQALDSRTNGDFWKIYPCCIEGERLSESCLDTEP